MFGARLLLLIALLGASVARADDVRVLVVDFAPKGKVSQDEAELLTSVVATHIANYERARALSGADVRELVALEADKQAAGCDDTSCLSEIAGALGACRWYGSAGGAGNSASSVSSSRLPACGASPSAGTSTAYRAS